MKTFFSLSVLLFLAGCGGSGTSEVLPQKDTNTTLYTTVLDNSFENNESTAWQKADWANGDPFYSAWCPQQIDINNSVLKIVLEQKDCHSYTHASGEYRTTDVYKYGRYTAKIKASDINGTITSFFTYTGATEGTDHDEIDVEIFGKEPTTMQVNYWRNGVEHPHIVELGFDASKDFHTYAFVWDQDMIQWYVDEHLVYSVTENNKNDNDSLPVNAGKIMINLWAAKGIESWSGTYTDGSVANAYYDFVRYEILGEN